MEALKDWQLAYATDRLAVFGKGIVQADRAAARLTLNEVQYPPAEIIACIRCELRHCS